MPLTFDERAATLIGRLEAADAEVRELIGEIPEERRGIVTNHDALGYFIDEYGLRFVGSIFPNLDVSAEPSPRDLAELIETIRREGVVAIFSESAVNPELAETIAAETDAQFVDEPLYADSLGTAWLGRRYARRDAAARRPGDPRRPRRGLSGRSSAALAATCLRSVRIGPPSRDRRSRAGAAPARSTHRSASARASSAVGCQPSSRRARRDEATRTGGSPTRRLSARAGMARPVTRRAASTTSRTLKPAAEPRL